MRRVLAHRDARRYLAAQVLSLFGDSTLWLGAGIWVKQLTGSASAAGLVFFFYTLPYAGAPLGGLLVDRVRRRPLMVVANLAAAGAVLLLLLVHDARRVWLVYLVMFLYGVSGTTLASAQSALLTGLLPARLLGEANGLLQTGRELLRLGSPLVGAGVVAAMGTVAPLAVFDAVTFVIAAAVLVRLRVREPAPAPPGAWWPDVSAGARHVWRTLPLRQIVLATAAALLVIGFGETLIFPVDQVGLHRPVAFVGVLLTAQGTGSVLGGLTAARLLRRLGDGATVAAGLTLFAAGTALLMVGNLAVVVTGLVAAGVGVPWVVVAFSTAVQQRTPAHLQGRAYAAADAAASLPQTVSIALGAGLVAVAGYRVLLATMAAVILAAAAYLTTRRVAWLS